ncbi:protein CUSTOS isoform X1 [Xiphophorus hellerii]|uniref:protein CUSTOS isoform X1 n=1 Tax=Xiphophorus hellerii TaxID=8084 RepID=UPI0013B37485|nr:protein CUSTOS isoform X1 [Xiphophorus hellerii]
MASRAGRRVSKDSSSSDDEELKKCREAVWESQTFKAKDGDGSVKQESKRHLIKTEGQSVYILLCNSVVVADHEHDGNELQVTQGFRKHVARKLENLLDSCISETQHIASKCLESKCDDGQDEGFRLFSTSVPGQEDAKPSSAPRRRPPPSSSDSDSEMETRLKEAAVSISDLLPSAMRSSSSVEPLGSEVGAKKKKVEEEEEHCVVKKKTKRKKEENKQDSVSSAHHQGNGEQEHSVVNIKQKKKKKRKRNAEEEALN